MSSNLGVMSRSRIVIPTVEDRTADHSKIYNQHRHHVYSLAFWMTDNELAAEQLAAKAFLRAFTSTSSSRTEQVDQALLAEIRELMPVGTLTFNCTISPATKNVRGNVKRVLLERAVVQAAAHRKINLPLS